MKPIRSVLQLGTNGLLGIAAISTCAMMIHVTADVIAKLIFRQPILGTLEIVSLFYMVAAVFLPLAAVQRDRENVFIELFTQHMSERAQRALDAFSLLLMFALSAVLFWKGLEVAFKKTELKELSQNLEFHIQIWPGRWCSVLGFGLMSLWCLVQFIDDLRVVFFGAAPEDDIHQHSDQNFGD